MSKVNKILANSSATISELQKNPTKVVSTGEGFPVAILNDDQAVFYCVPSGLWEEIFDRLDDVGLAVLANERIERESIKVNLDEL